MTVANDLQCLECQAEVRDYLGDHLLEVHKLSVQEYLARHPGAPTVSDRLWATFQATNRSKKRAHPPVPENLSVSLAGTSFSVNLDVPADACLPMPSHYRLPRYGSLGEDIAHTLIALKGGRSIYIWGMPGSGKDALFHAWSSLTRTPALFLQMQPGADIESWFFSRAFNDKGTYWEEGAVLQAARDGYLTASGRRVPYLILVTDFDRGEPEQAEGMRILMDTISGRVRGPAGTSYKVLPGTIIVATGNTAGGGDERARMTSAMPIDGSLFDRFERVFQYHWMDWKDEEIIVQEKFPLLFQRAPSVFQKMREVTKKLREAILNGDLHAEFSHRGLCTILGHAQDVMIHSGKLSNKILKWSVRAWVDRLPDEENRQAALNIMDPHIGTIPEGDTTHIKPGDLTVQGI